MATVPVPSVNTPTYAPWAAAVATKLNTTAQLYRAADVSMSVSNGVWTTALPAAVGPCIVTVQGTMTLNAAGQYAIAQLKAGNSFGPTVQVSSAGGQSFPISLTMPIATAAGAAYAVWTLGSAGITGTVSTITYVVVPYHGDAAPIPAII